MNVHQAASRPYLDLEANPPEALLFLEDGLVIDGDLDRLETFIVEAGVRHVREQDGLGEFLVPSDVVWVEGTCGVGV